MRAHNETLSVAAMRWTRLCDFKKKLVDQAALRHRRSLI
jgi:hypothetical protein